MRLALLSGGSQLWAEFPQSWPPQGMALETSASCRKRGEMVPPCKQFTRRCKRLQPPETLRTEPCLRGTPSPSARPRGCAKPAMLRCIMRIMFIMSNSMGNDINDLALIGCNDRAFGAETA